MNENALLELILGEIKEISKEQKDMGKTLAVQSEVLKDHTRRSEINEEGLRLAREEMKPLQKHVAVVGIVLKICGGITAVAGFVLIVLNIISSVSEIFHL